MTSLFWYPLLKSGCFEIIPTSSFAYGKSKLEALRIQRSVLITAASVGLFLIILSLSALKTVPFSIFLQLHLFPCRIGIIMIDVNHAICRIAACFFKKWKGWDLFYAICPVVFFYLSHGFSNWYLLWSRSFSSILPLGYFQRQHCVCHVLSSWGKQCLKAFYLLRFMVLKLSGTAVLTFVL